MSAGAGLPTMATISDTILTARKAPHAFQPIVFTRTSTATVGSSGVISSTRETAVTDANGLFSITLATGIYLPKWRIQGVWNPPADANGREFSITVPDGNGTFSFEDLADDGGAIYPDLKVKWFNTVDTMLAEPADNWTNGRVRDTYGTGVISGWELVPKGSTPAEGLAEDGDGKRETTDGLAFAVRIWTAG